MAYAFHLVSGSFDIVLLLDLNLPEPEPLGDWVLFGETMEKEGRGAYPRFLKLFAETLKRHLAKAPGSTVFLYSLTFVFRYWYLFV